LFLFVERGMTGAQHLMQFSEGGIWDTAPRFIILSNTV
jgi:hypothetical protein